MVYILPDISFDIIGIHFNIKCVIYSWLEPNLRHRLALLNIALVVFFSAMHTNAKSKPNTFDVHAKWCRNGWNK